tara:strand:+ start:616 stop:1467 length:852 start_codon:yes stop_codon:yes gene_type:complete
MSDIQKVKELRRLTGAGFKDCNSALKESNGDLEKSIEILRIKGISKASKKMSRDANEGLVCISENANQISMLEINCETDFVAKNNDFLSFAEELSKINNNVNSDLSQLNNEKMNNGKKVSENLVELISKIGEKITIGRSKTFSNINQKNYFYLHSIIKNNIAKLGVIVSIENDNYDEKIDNFGKQLSMHIAATSPLAINENDIDSEIIEKEKKLIDEELKNSGKSIDIIEKISLGKIKKYKQDNSLMSQLWVMDSKKKVSDIIKELNFPALKVKDFYRLKIGD